MFDDNADINGLAFSIGLGVGVDVHVIQTQTVTLWPNRKNSSVRSKNGSKARISRGSRIMLQGNHARAVSISVIK